MYFGHVGLYCAGVANFAPGSSMGRGTWSNFKKVFYEITENTLTLLIICGFALMVRLPATIGSIIMMRNSKEKEE